MEPIGEANYLENTKNFLQSNKTDLASNAWKNILDNRYLL